MKKLWHFKFVIDHYWPLYYHTVAMWKFRSGALACLKLKQKQLWLGENGAFHRGFFKKCFWRHACTLQYKSYDEYQLYSGYYLIYYRMIWLLQWPRGLKHKQTRKEVHLKKKMLLEKGNNTISPFQSCFLFCLYLSPLNHHVNPLAPVCNACLSKT